MAARPLKVMLVAAEASGDALGAGLARALKARLGPDVAFVGLGGEAMAREGVQSAFDISELSIFGYADGIRAWPRVVRRAEEMALLAVREQPDVAVLIDSWGFTLRVAHRLREALPDLGIVKYVGPQVWASRPGRARTLAQAVDLLLAIHAFDAPWFEKAGLKTVFVGNPALARDFSAADPARLRKHIGAGAGEQILLVLPGSRPGEVARLLPPFEDAAARLKADRQNLHIVMPVASTVAAAVRAGVAGWRHPPHLIEDETLKADAFVAATVALACSGTATTELALAGRPMIVAYRLGPVTWFAIKRIATARFATLLNIAAGRMVVPELLQSACNGLELAYEVGMRLDDPALAARQVAEQTAVLDRMGRGQGDPSGRAADALIDFLKSRGTL